MHMWGEMMPKRGHPEYPAKISIEALELLVIESDHMFILVPFPYMGLDWQQCPKILFTQNEPTYVIGTISFFFKLI